MKVNSHIATMAFVTLLAFSWTVQAADGNWKRGRVYYKHVCTVCHVEQTGDPISPATMTRAEWKSYLDADSHAKGKDKVSYYVSQEYRNSVKDKNRAAKKFLKLPNETLAADLRAFVIHGAKDSDSPARCN